MNEYGYGPLIIIMVDDDDHVNQWIGLSNDENIGLHVIALQDIPIGTLILKPSCVMDAMKNCDYCDACKIRLTEDHDQKCILCNGVAFCRDCLPIMKKFHSKECRAINNLELELEECGTTKDAQTAIESTSRQNILLALRWAIHRNMRYNNNDPFVSNVWNNGVVPEKLLTHENSRGVTELKSIYATARFILKIVHRHCDDCETTEAEIAQFLQIVRVNGHGIMDPLLQECVGVGLFPSASCFNHSCIPNTDFLPDSEGMLKFVTLREVKKGEELTITYTDIITQCTAERIESLEIDYFFQCLCKRCTGRFRYDEILASGLEDEIKRVELLHDHAERANSISKGLQRFLDAEASTLPELHRLRWKTHHGILIHAIARKKWKHVWTAANSLLIYFSKLEDESGTLLPVAQVHLHLQQANAARFLGDSYVVQGKEKLQCAIRALEPFGTDVTGLRFWLAHFEGMPSDASVHEIAYRWV